LKLERALGQGLSVGVLVFAISLVSEVPAASNDPNSTIAIQQLLRQAQRLEEDGHWARAAEIYERLPARERNRTGVAERFRSCLRRVQQLRRHQDPSYREQVLTLSWHEGLDIYGEVLQKLRLYYVDRDKVELTRLFRQGLEELRLALSDGAFCAQHLPGTSLDTVRAFQAELQAYGSDQRIDRISDAQDQVQIVAWSAEEKLGLRKTAAIFEFVCGACSGLDEYTYYLTPAELEAINASWEGKRVGVGIEVGMLDQRLVITRVLPGSSAQAKGLKVGDSVTGIDGQRTLQLPAETATELLKGEVDTTVQLEVLTGASDWYQNGTAVRLVQLKRQALSVPSVSEPRFLDEGREIGYLQLIVFQDTTLTELDDAIRRLQAAGMRALILDLRGNPGGPFEIAVQVAERFLASGVIVMTHGQISGVRDYNKTYQAHSASALTVPLVMLVDADTASSAEMVAGAIRENQRGKLVGDTTFGKGSIQRVDKLTKAPLAGVRMTVARFYAPSGRPYGNTGVIPDIVVRPEASMDVGEDAQLQAALDIARPLTMVR
jgi:carboxyl-terminal processing protease